jgi:hypothetical protein
VRSKALPLPTLPSKTSSLPTYFYALQILNRHSFPCVTGSLGILDTSQLQQRDKSAFQNGYIKTEEASHLWRPRRNNFGPCCNIATERPLYDLRRRRLDNSLHPPDPENPVSGSNTGVVATADIKTVGDQRLFFNLYGSYSLVNNTYWSRARVGYNFGPEGAFYGGETFNSERAGAFIDLKFRRFDLTFAGGFNFVANKEFFDALGSGSFAGLGGIFADSGYGNVSTTWF